MPQKNSNISATAGYIMIEVDQRDALDTIDAVREAFKQAGMDIPKHLDDAFFGLEIQTPESGVYESKEPNCYVVLIDAGKTTDAREFLNSVEGRVMNCTNAQEIRDVLNKEIGDNVCNVYAISEFMEEFNDTDDDHTFVAVKENFMGYVYTK